MVSPPPGLCCIAFTYISLTNISFTTLEKHLFIFRSVFAETRIAAMNPLFSANSSKKAWVIYSSRSSSATFSTRSNLLTTSIIGMGSPFLSVVLVSTYSFHLIVDSIESLLLISATTRAPRAPRQNNLLMPPTRESYPTRSHNYSLNSFSSSLMIFIEKSQATVAL